MKNKKIISFVLSLVFSFQLIQNIAFAMPIESNEKETATLKITKQDFIKDKESNSISFSVKVKNEGIESVDLSKLNLSYWYSDNAIKGEVVNKDWISIDKNNIIVDIEKLDKEFDKSNSRINIGFKAEASSLKPAEEIELNLRVTNSENINYNQENNFSFIKDITAEYNGKLIYGEMPKEVAAKEDVIKVKSQMYNKNRDGDTGAIYPWIKVINEGNINLDLAKLEVRYYYTNDNINNVEEQSVIDWANIGKENVISSFGELQDFEDANKYFSLKFNMGKDLEVGKEIELHTRFNKKDWGTYNQNNDYSFNEKSEDYTDWNKILVIYDGKIISGEEPEINDGLQIIDVESIRIQEIVSLKWNEIKDMKYSIEKGTSYDELKEIEKNLDSNVYMDQEADILESEYYYRIFAYDKNDQKVAKSRKIKVNSFIDTDNDNLIDEEEIKLGTDINNSDTDDDGLLDGEEVLQYKTNPLEVDSDKDGLDDFYEVYISETNPLKNDTDGDSILDGDEDSDEDGIKIKEEIILKTNPNEPDSDFDGLNDNKEVNIYKTNPNGADTDGDGIKDGLEIELKLDPNKVDTDENGVLDGDEKVEYTKIPGKIELDKNVTVKVNGQFEAKKINEIFIANMSGTHVMTSNETPGYIGAPYLVRVPKGSNNTQIIFEYNKDVLPESANPTLYKLDRVKNTLVEVENQNKDLENIIVIESRDNEGIIPQNENLQDDNNYIIIDKTAWDKYWESEIKHPLEKGKLDLSFVVDTSGSMSSNDPNKYRVKLAEHFINKKQEEDRFSLVGFQSYATVYQELTNDKKKLLDNAGRLGSQSGGTHISSGLESGISQLQLSEGRDKKIILISDGDGTFYDSTLVKAKEAGIEIFTIGVGSSFNAALLEKIASETGGKYYHVKNEDEFGNIIDEVHGDAGKKDTDGDGIPDDQDENPLEHGIDNSEFTIGDKLFMQASNFAYQSTDDKIEKVVDSGVDFSLINDWQVIGSDDSNDEEDDGHDSGFGAVAISKGDKIIISFEGSGKFWSEEGWNDWIKTDLGVIGGGNQSKQIFSSYKFIDKIISKNSGKSIYFTGHSLGGWLAQKVGGSLLEGKVNLTMDSEFKKEYYFKNNVPKKLKEDVSKMYYDNFSKNDSNINKIVTFASPGFKQMTSIYEDESKSREIVHNYRLEKDPISRVGSDKYSLGRNLWKIKDKDKEIGGFEAHSITTYYNYIEEFYKEGYTEERNG